MCVRSCVHERMILQGERRFYSILSNLQHRHDRMRHQQIVESCSASSVLRELVWHYLSSCLLKRADNKEGQTGTPGEQGPDGEEKGNAVGRDERG